MTNRPLPRLPSEGEMGTSGAASPKIHPKLAKLFAAGESVFPSEDTLAKDASNDEDAHDLGSVLKLVLEEYNHIAKTRAAKSKSKGLDSWDDGALQAILGTGISLQTIDYQKAVYDSDVIGLKDIVLRPDDFIQVSTNICNQSPVYFKLGSPLPDFGDVRLDRHRASCWPVLELQVKYVPSSGPLLVAQHTQTIFESARGGKEYFRRGWRYLSENWLLEFQDSSEARKLSTTMLHSLHQNQLQLPKDALLPIKSLYEEGRCRIYRTHRSALGPLQLDQHDSIEYVTPTDVVMAVFSVDCAVSKVVMAAKVGEIPLAHFVSVILDVIRRQESWFRIEKHLVHKALLAIPPNLLRFRTELIDAWRNSIETRVKKLPSTSESSVTAPCLGCGCIETLRRCAGCKAASYCSRKCQRDEWSRGHSAECTKEFLSLTDAETKSLSIISQLS